MHTWVQDEDRQLKNTYQRLSSTQPKLATKLLSLFHVQSRVNNIHRARLHAIYELARFTGVSRPGVKLGHMEVHDPSTTVNPSMPEESVMIEVLEAEHDMEVGDDDQANDECLKIQLMRDYTSYEPSNSIENLSGERPGTPYPLAAGHIRLGKDSYQQEDVYVDMTSQVDATLTLLERYTDCVAITFTARTDYSGGGDITPSEINVSVHAPHITLHSEEMNLACQDMMDIFRHHLALPGVLQREARRGHASTTSPPANSETVPSRMDPEPQLAVPRSSFPVLRTPPTSPTAPASASMKSTSKSATEQPPTK
ncbi:hypothetical protein JB92DRAFT_3132915 [Gautieria morchelliformis]|nr:hypothetical protein JB92DRAFT_3132915 [Gautieria morchelliformis]